MPTIAATMSFRSVVTLYSLSLGGLLLSFSLTTWLLLADDVPEGTVPWLVIAAIMALACNVTAILAMVSACATAATSLERLVGLSRPGKADLLRRLAEGVGLVDRALTTVEAEAERLNHADPLTGLGNRRWLQLCAPRALQQANHEDTALALIVIRIDHLQAINASFGYDAGDRALITCADILRSQLRRGDLAGRVSGNEFLVLLPGVGSLSAKAILERLRGAINSTPLAVLDEMTLQVRIATVQANHDKVLDPPLARVQAALDEQPVSAELRPRPAPAAAGLPDAERALTLM